MYYPSEQDQEVLSPISTKNCGTAASFFPTRYCFCQSGPSHSGTARCFSNMSIMLSSLCLFSASVSSPFESLSSTVSKPLGYLRSFSLAHSFYGLSSECCRVVAAHRHFSLLLFLCSSYGQCFLYIMKEKVRFYLGKKWFQVSNTVQASTLKV